MPRGKAVALDFMKRARALRRAADDQTGASEPTSRNPCRWRVLEGSLAQQWRMACSKVSGALRHLGQVAGTSLSQAGWARR